MDSFESVTLPPPHEKVDKADWVEMQLLRVFMRDLPRSLYTSAITVFAVGGLLLGSVPLWQLGLWIAAMLAVTAARLGVVRTYYQSLRGVSGQPLVAFMRRYEWLWPFSACLWGSMVWLFFLRASVVDQFACMLVLVGVASMAVNSFGARRGCVLGFIDLLLLSAAIALLARANSVTGGLGDTREILLMALLVATFWALVRSAAKRLHQTLRTGLELQFDNSVLITSLTEKSRSALQAVATKNRFIASAAHDLRQPVHALNLYAGWLNDDPHLAQQITPKIVRSTQVLDELFDSLFYYSGLNSDPLTVRLQPVDLQELLAVMKQQFDAVAVERGLDLQLVTEPGTLWTDPVLIKRLLANFLTNAFKHTQRGGVLLSVKWRKSNWRIEVADTGSGIAEEHRKAVFEEFYRAPSAGTQEGFGLGLAIVMRLSRALGHRVGVRSAVDVGSVFWVDVKAAEPASGSTAALGSAIG